jgi:Glycosyl hydrolases family 18
MAKETFVNYWIGQEPTPPSPPLNAMPSYVDVAPLAFVTIDDQWQLDFSFLCTTNPPDVIQGWIKEVRANGTRVLFSINDQKLGSVPDVDAFVETVVKAAVEWGVDGIDFDYEGWDTPSETMIDVVRAMRPALAKALGTNPYLSAPVYSPWLDYRDFLHELSNELDLVTTMDYTPYPGYDETVRLFFEYQGALGLPQDLAIGVSCMGPPDSGNFTPLEDVEKLCKYELAPRFGPKAGIMLYTFSYDVETRAGSGTGYPDGTYTKTIEANLPDPGRALG